MPFHDAHKRSSRSADPLTGTPLQELGEALNAGLAANAGRKTITSGRGGDGESKIASAEFNSAKGKPLIDRIVGRPAAHYGLALEEAETVKTSDLNYRTGGEDHRRPPAYPLRYSATPSPPTSAPLSPPPAHVSHPTPDALTLYPGPKASQLQIRSEREVPHGLGVRAATDPP